MFDCVLNTPLNTIEYYNNFFPGVSRIKFNDFLNFFSTINFPCQYLPEAKAYLEPSQTFYNGTFSWNIFSPKFTGKHLSWSLILIKLQVSILQFYWKKGLLHRCFLVNFARYLRHFLQNTSRWLLLFCGKNILSTK